MLYRRIDIQRIFTDMVSAYLDEGALLDAINDRGQYHCLFNAELACANRRRVFIQVLERNFHRVDIIITIKCRGNLENKITYLTFYEYKGMYTDSKEEWDNMNKISQTRKMLRGEITEYRDNKVAYNSDVILGIVKKMVGFKRTKREDIVRVGKDCMGYNIYIRKNGKVHKIKIR